MQILLNTSPRNDVVYMPWRQAEVTSFTRPFLAFCVRRGWPARLELLCNRNQCYRIAANFCKNGTRGSKRYFHGCDKTLHNAVQTGLLKFSGFYFCGSWLIRENHKSQHRAKVSRYILWYYLDSFVLVLVYRTLKDFYISISTFYFVSSVVSWLSC